MKKETLKNIKLVIVFITFLTNVGAASAQSGTTMCGCQKGMRPIYMFDVKDNVPSCKALVCKPWQCLKPFPDLISDELDPSSDKDGVPAYEPADLSKCYEEISKFCIKTIEPKSPASPKQ